MDQDDRIIEREESRYGQGFLTGVLVTLCVLLLFGIGYMLIRSGVPGADRRDSLKEMGASVLTDGSTISKLREVETLIEENYLKEADGALLSDYLFKGAAVGLDDPYADYYTAEELQSVLDSSNGEYFGIGVTLSEDRTTGVISVAQVYEGSPAHKAGLEVDDVVKQVDGSSIEGADLSELVKMIKGKEGSLSMTL